MQTLDAMPENPATEESRPGAFDRVLVAAGTAAEGQSLAAWIEREGFDVMTATDGREALLIAGSSWQPDIVLLDPMLPEGDGSSVYEQFRARNRVAVILVLGAGSEADEVRNLEAGADDYVGKRFSPEVLLARMRAHLRSRQASGNQRILQTGDLWLDTKNYAARVKGD
jgi:DNA-binding response OmpR family regulator